MQIQSHSYCFQGLNLHTLEWLTEKQPQDSLWIFLHGYLDHGLSFDTLIHSLAKRVPGRFLAWDARGHGRSGHIAPHAYYHFYDYLYDLEQWLQQLQAYHQLFLVGHSMGGMIASMYAGTFPERVTGFVNLEGWMAPEASPDSIPDRVRQWLSQRENLRPFRIYPDIQSAAQKLKQQDPLLSDEQALKQAETGTYETENAYQWRHDPLHKTRSPQPFRLDQAQAFWSRIKSPSLLLYGDQSRILKLPDHKERMALFPNAEQHCIANAGHNLHLHQAPTIAKHIHQWTRDQAFFD